MSNFDDFYGPRNFDGSRNKVIIIEEEEVECRSEKVRIVQQRLAILHELSKRIIEEQICDVETRIIIIQQHLSKINSYSNDISRKSGRAPGYDSNIASKASQIINSDGSLNTDDLGFSGSDIGSNYNTLGGSNWNDATSPQSVSNAENAAQEALRSSQSN